MLQGSAGQCRAVHHRRSGSAVTCIGPHVLVRLHPLCSGSLPAPASRLLVCSSGCCCPQAFDVPQPKDLTTADRELVERSRFLSETYKYSGYYVVPDPSRTQLLQQHRLVSSSFAPDGSAAQQIYTHTFERYSDRYRKILGKKTFHSEIESPNTHLFPAELLSDKNGRAIRAAGNTTFTSKVQFLSTKTLLSEVTVRRRGEARRSEARGQRRGVTPRGSVQVPFLHFPPSVLTCSSAAPLNCLSLSAPGDCARTCRRYER